MTEMPAPPDPPDPSTVARPRRPSVGQYVGFAVLGGLGLLVVLVIAAGAYGIAREYGADQVPWLGIAPWALVPAAFWTAATAVLCRGRETRSGWSGSPWLPWIVGVGVLAITTLLGGVLTALAASAHDAQIARMAAACSPADVAVLTQVPGYSADLGVPTGQADGTCSIVLGARADAVGAVEAVVDAMVAGGWNAAPVAADGSVVVTRSGVYVVVRAGSSDGKGWTDVVVEIPAG